MLRRRLTVPLLAVALSASATAAPPASAADAYTTAVQNWQKKIKAQIAAALAKAQAQYKAQQIKNGLDPNKPFVAKGFTVEIPVGGLGTQIAGLGVNITGTAAAVAVGTPLGVTGDLYFVDTVRKVATKVPQGIALPFDGTNAISADGKRVVFNSGIGPLTRPYAFVQGAIAPTQLATRATRQPTISTDGTTYAVSADGGILGLDSVAYGDPKVGTLTNIETADAIGTKFGRPQVSGDGRYIGYLVTKNTVTTYHQFDRRSGKLAVLDLVAKGIPTGGSQVLTDWSWNNRYLLITRTAGSTRTVWSVDRVGIARLVTTLPAAASGESPPTFRADAAAVAIATPTPTDATDTNSTTDLAWANVAGTSYQRQSFDSSNVQLTSGIGLTPLGTRVPRFAIADTATASYWVQRAATGGGETLYVRTTLPVANPPATPTPTPAPVTTPAPVS